jgi:predicted thioesterase
MREDQSRTWPIVARTLWAAVAAERQAAPLDDAVATLGAQLHRSTPPHPAAPSVGAAAVTTFRVTEADTAAAMGHPDPTMNVLGSPRIGLWFELATSPLMPDPGATVRHVGVGLVVHHLAVAEVGEEVAVEAKVVDASGRAVMFTLEATAGNRCVARGVHHRRILDT